MLFKVHLFNKKMLYVKTQYRASLIQENLKCKDNASDDIKL